MAQVLQRKRGRERVRMTVYLPPKLARDLHLRAATAGVEMSDIVTAALEVAFKPPPKPAAQSAPDAMAVRRDAPAPASGSGATLHPDVSPWVGVRMEDPFPSVQDAARWNLRQIYGYAAHLRTLRKQRDCSSVDGWVEAVIALRGPRARAPRGDV